MIVEKERKEAIEGEAQREQQQAQEQREREAQAVRAEQLRKQAAIDAQPARKLLKAYRSYIGVRQCSDARKGYAAVDINEEQAADAKVLVPAIERTLKAADPTIDDTAIWKKANEPESRCDADQRDSSCIPVGGRHRRAMDVIAGLDRRVERLL